MRVAPSPALRGEAEVPGDKSVTVRGFFLGLLGTVEMEGASTGADAASARGAVEAFGAVVDGDGPRVAVSPGESPPREVRVDAGNSGTTARLALGWAAGGQGEALVDGDDSLRSRPFGPLAEDLEAWGASVESAEGRFPASAGGVVEGQHHATMRPGSGTRKAALLLAAARSGAGLTWTERPSARAHSERLHAWARGAEEPLHLTVPPDASAFAVLASAAAVRPGSAIRGKVLHTPRRCGLLRHLAALGVRVEEAPASGGPEPVAEVAVERHSDLVGGFLEVSGQDLMDMLDEVPAAAVVAAVRRGETRFRTAGWLAGKESDRLESTAAFLASVGARARVEGGDLVVEGGGIGGGEAETAGDHRLVLAAGVAGLAAESPVEIPEASLGAVAFPGWEDSLARLGARLG